MFSFVLDAHQQFRSGSQRLLQKLWAMGVFPASTQKAPSRIAYHKACAKLPVKVVAGALERSHQQARDERDQLYHGMRVSVVDGTKIVVPRTEQTIEAYGLGTGSAGKTYFPQIHAVGFFDLSTTTFSAFNLDHGTRQERRVMLQHAQANENKTLYVGDAGFNGAAHVYFMQQTGHELLIQLKAVAGRIVKEFRASRKRSQIVEIKLTWDRLEGYPEHRHLIGQTFKVRLIRTRGTTKLRSLVLLTTLLDEDEYPWQELARLYLQRWNIEGAFRHVKTTLQIEHIKKFSLHRLRQLTYGCLILYNLASMLRNLVQRPRLFPAREGTKVYCFELAIEFVDLFCLAVLYRVRGQLRAMRRRLSAIRQTYFRYAPFRARPRIRRFPISRWPA